MMDKLRVLSIFGTRPEAVKMAPVVKALSRVPQVDAKICVTAQHREMLDQVLEIFSMKPDVDLNLMHPDQNLADLTAEIITHLAPVLEDLKPDWILVQGDTTTVMTASLLAYYQRIRIGHVEAGLRTHDRWQPFPEEINRRITGVVADLHFAPTETNRANLLREGIEDWRIRVTGNPVVDALNDILKRQRPADIDQFLRRLDILSGKRRLILVTAHRRENFGNPLEQICISLRSLANMFQEQIEIVYPVHLNPNVQEPVRAMLAGIDHIHLLPPLDYLPMAHLMRNAWLILTDSGGIQEEATALGIPTLVLREVTERPEGVESGILKLVGTDSTKILQEVQYLLNNTSAYLSMAQSQNPFGDGHAAQRIVSALLEFNEPSLG